MATVITGFAAFIACASAMNILTVSVLAAACVFAGWLARERHTRHREHREDRSVVVDEGRLRRILARRYPF
ncbi:hypothetical protein [Nocardia transvalensis]|uniref:hypothetical protein n=1 Tax=Nocardia transvalensis TaxID=37333 RepID=UPI0018941F9A|nr:hypothetical protein [Nocardia transvalensis]MBF6328364.1 hypothetical protein [Nocardia transvalensis]